jgi:hypothetical protein
MIADDHSRAPAEILAGTVQGERRERRLARQSEHETMAGYTFGITYENMELAAGLETPSVDETTAERRMYTTTFPTT